MLFFCHACRTCVLNKYDDSEIWNKVNENEARIAALEEQCRGFNQDLQTLRTIVNALQGNDYVTGVVEVIKEGPLSGTRSRSAKAAR